jgi:hypothetical protein
MEPFVGLALVVMNQLVDKHFHKIPNKLFEPDTYKPRRTTHNSRKRSEQTRSNPSSESDSEDGKTSSKYRERDRGINKHPVLEVEHDNMRHQDIPRHSGQGRGPSYFGPELYTYPPIYSHDAPRQRSQYIPPQKPVQYRYVPESSYRRNLRYPDRDGTYNRDDKYSGSPRSSRRRQKVVTKRSNSYYGQRDKA